MLRGPKQREERRRLQENAESARLEAATEADAGAFLDRIGAEITETICKNPEKKEDIAETLINAGRSSGRGATLLPAWMTNPL